MRSGDRTRTLIFGNSGSGKTWLARKLAEAWKRTAIHMDDLRWEPGNYGMSRDNQTVVNEIIQTADTDQWLMEGVYGWLAKPVLPRATTLIWLDLPEEECVANVKARGIQGSGSPQAFEELLKWISEYRVRDNSSCHKAHSALSLDFPPQNSSYKADRKSASSWPRTLPHPNLG
jgi:adenylate kinase family enzyme